MKKTFPKGFYWGAATASYQVEGGIENNDWAEAAREGRVPPCGRACDHYNRYEEDFDIAQSLGHNAHRLSIEWARIEPEEGVFDERAVEHYRDVLRALRTRNIEPYVTLWHFTLPLWFSKKGGFEQKSSPEIFARYCAYVVERLGDLCGHFSTINEPNVFASLGYLKGMWPPFRKFALIDRIEVTRSGYPDMARPKAGISSYFMYERVARTLADAHNAAYAKIKSTAPQATVGVVKHVVAFDADASPFNRLRMHLGNHFWNDIFLRRTHAACDVLYLNYYHYRKYGDTETYRKTNMNWDFVPEGIYRALHILNRYNKPIFVSEAGLADADDRHRAEYIQKQVEATWRAIQDGVDVRGHMYWSLLDNYEWAFGFEKRFGLVEIDYDTLARTIRPSAYVYKKICENNAIEW